jgi:hypothetical protein
VIIYFAEQLAAVLRVSLVFPVPFIFPFFMIFFPLLYFSPCKVKKRGAQLTISTGRVKLGIHKQTGEKVAIKMISRSHLVSSRSTSKSVQRELAILQLLYHPHLIDLRQVLQDSTYVYFVMEYLEGGELFHLLAERGRLPESEARHLFGQLVSALAWCHAHQIRYDTLLQKKKKKKKKKKKTMDSLFY